MGDNNARGRANDVVVAALAIGAEWLSLVLKPLVRDTDDDVMLFKSFIADVLCIRRLFYLLRFTLDGSSYYSPHGQGHGHALLTSFSLSLPSSIFRLFCDKNDTYLLSYTTFN